MSQGLCLVDGYSVIYRGYFAFLNRPLLNPLGQNSSSVFVFFRTLFQIARELSPGSIVVAMDSRVPTFRHLRYEPYKATREKAPDDLHAQVPVIEEILAALRIPSISVNGFEADDIIATVAEECRSTGLPCWILSADKDILQLIGSNIRLLAQEKGSSFAEYSREKVVELKGVTPEQIVDFLALTGDSSDNVPGVKGIGEKTAQKLLAEFGSLAAMYERLGDVAPASVRAKLEAGRADAELSRELVTLRRDVPGVPPVKSMSPLAFDDRAVVKAAESLFLREGMKTLALELAALAKGGRPAPSRPEAAPAAETTAAPGPAPAGAPSPVLRTTAPGTYTAITSLSELDLWIERALRAGTVAFDVETDGVDEMRAVPLGFSLSFEEGKACYIPIRAKGATCLPEQAVKERLARLLEDPAVRIVGQNTKYDYKVVRRWGVRPAVIAFDTMIAAWVLDTEEGLYNLDRMAERRLGFRTKPYTDLVGKDQTLEDIPLQEVTDYSGEDADLTLRLYHILAKELVDEGLAPVFHEIEMPLIPVLAEMELAGIRILPTELAAYSTEMEGELARIEQEVYALCGRPFNINSTKQLQEVLFTWRGLTPVKKTKTGFSTDVDVLEILAAQDPVPEKILQHRKLYKLKSTYVDALPLLVNPDTGRLHTHYVQTGAATGRLASKDPNLQNIPIREEEGRRIRRAFVPAPGMRFVSADYAQIELAILAYLSKDPILLKAFEEGKDIHRQTAALIFGVTEAEVTADQRRVGKTINFGVVYGMSAFGLAQGLRIPRSDADLFIKTYFQRYEGVDRFLKETIRTAEETGAVRTLMGRRRKIPAITSRNRTEKTGAERMAVNSPIQGTAADLVKMAMVKLFVRLREEGLAARILLQVHDEIILECPEAEAAGVQALVREVMEGVTTHAIPLKVQCDVGESWGGFH
jgi:DNA polymerase I